MVDHNQRLFDYIQYTISRPCYKRGRAKVGARELNWKITAAWQAGKITGAQSAALQSLIK